MKNARTDSVGLFRSSSTYAINTTAAKTEIKIASSFFIIKYNAANSGRERSEVPPALLTVLLGLVIRILTYKYLILATEGLPFVHIATALPSKGRDRNGPAEGFS
jgi:hypothetical protein